MNYCARRPCFIDHLYLASDFRQGTRRNFLQFFPFLVHRCFCCRNFHSLRHRNKFVNQIVVLFGIFTLFCNMVFMMIRQWFSYPQSCRFANSQNTRKFCFNFIGCTIPTILTALGNFLQGIARATGVSNFLRAFLMVSLNILSSESMNWIPRNFRALSRWSFSCDHFCFSFSLAFFPIFSQSSN